MSITTDAGARRAAIRSILVDAQMRLLAALDGVRGDDWSMVTPNEGWRVRDVLAHLSSSEAGFLSTLKRMARGEGGVPADFDPDRWNAGQVRRRTESTPEQLRTELQTAHEEMLAFLETVDGEALDRRGYLSTGREGNLEDNFDLVASHKRTHTADVEAALRGKA